MGAVYTGPIVFGRLLILRSQQRESQSFFLPKLQFVSLNAICCVTLK